MKTTQKTREEAQKIENKAGAPISLICAHFLNIGEQVAKHLTTEKIEKVFQSEKAKEKEAEKNNEIYIVTPEFTKAVLIGCYMLAYSKEKRAIIKAYL